MEATTESKLKPIGDRIFCRRIENEDKVEGGIIIPDAAQEKSVEAVVIAVGPGKMVQDGSIIPVNVVPGMKIILPKFGGTDVEIDGKPYTIVHEDDIDCMIG